MEPDKQAPAAQNWSSWLIDTINTRMQKVVETIDHVGNAAVEAIGDRFGALLSAATEKFASSAGDAMRRGSDGISKGVSAASLEKSAPSLKIEKEAPQPTITKSIEPQVKNDLAKIDLSGLKSAMTSSIKEVGDSVISAPTFSAPGRAVQAMQVG